MTGEWVPGNKPELMSAIEREWNLLMKVVEKLSGTQMTVADEGGWSLKDNLAHLTEWMKILMGYHMEHRPSHEVVGVSEEIAKAWDMEVINPILFERNRHRSTGEVLDELKSVYKQLISRLDSMSYEDLLKSRLPDDPEKRPLVLYVLGDSADHFMEHRETMEKILKK
jgi:hypothetical protein